MKMVSLFLQFGAFLSPSMAVYSSPIIYMVEVVNTVDKSSLCNKYRRTEQLQWWAVVKDDIMLHACYEGVQ